MASRPVYQDVFFLLTDFKVNQQENVWQNVFLSV